LERRGELINYFEQAKESVAALDNTWADITALKVLTGIFNDKNLEPNQKDYLVSALAEKAGKINKSLEFINFMKGFRDTAEPNNARPPLEIIRMSDVEQEDVQWLWKPYVPMGKITILQGDPGLGKTFVALQIAAIVSAGRYFPGDTVGVGNIPGAVCDPGNVIFQTAEDGLADTVRARLNDADADCSRIYVIDEQTEGLTLDDERLRESVSMLRPKLVIIDPLQAYLGADKDMHRANEIRPVLHRLSNLAAEFKCAVILIGHQNKSNGGKNIYRGLGSIDIAAAARSIIAVGEYQKTAYRRAIVQIKSSLAASGKSLLYDLDPMRGFLWAGTSDLTADEILNAPAEREAPERDGCEQFLRELLEDGDVTADEVFKAAKVNGFSVDTVKRAKKEANIKSYKEKITGGKWMWSLTLHPPLPTLQPLQPLPILPPLPIL
jgi:archaellum biogenesis ATPase FlaH